MQIEKIYELTGAAPLTSVQAAAKTDGFSSYLGQETMEDVFKQASETYDLPLSLLTAVGMQESTFRTNAVSPHGAQGVMQLMPATARELGVTDSFDMKQNIMGGAKYLRQMLDRFDGDIPFALAAYNAGANNVEKYGGVPPFQETQNYVEKVMGYMANGVTLPDGTEIAGNTGIVTTGADGSQTAEKMRTSLSDLLFSHDDYLRFLELYMAWAFGDDEKGNG